MVNIIDWKMFATSDDPLNIVCGLRNISTIGRHSMTSLWFIGTFCANFLSYQLKTWQMFADINNCDINNSLNINRMNSHPSYHKQDDNQWAGGKIYAKNPNPMVSANQRGLKDFAKLNTMRTGSIDDNYQVSTVICPNNRLVAHPQIWRPQCTLATTSSASLAKNDARNKLTNQTTPSTRFGGPSTTVNEVPQFNNECYQTSHFASYHCGRISPARYRGAQNAATNFWSQTSMDEQSEYLAAKNSGSNQYYHTSNYQSCHRPRNASYSSVRPNNSATSSKHHESIYYHHQQQTPPTASNMSNSGSRLLSHCSPSSSGSLPASLQLCNKHSCSGSFDISLEEPVSLPLVNVAGRKVQQSGFSNVHHKRPPFDGNQRVGNQVCGQPEVTGYRWHRDYDTGTNQSAGKQTLGRQIFKHSVYNHPIAVGSDSELYSHLKQQTDRRNMNRSAAGKSESAMDQTNRNSQQSKKTSDTLRANGKQINRLVQTSKNVQEVNSITRVQPIDAAKGSNSDNKLSLAGTIRRLGFKQKGLLSLSVQRSEEVLPRTENRQSQIGQMGFSSFTESRIDSGSLNISWLGEQQTRSDSMDPRTKFIDGLGPGQIASRQALVSPYLGDIQLTLNDRRGMLEVEVVRARKLQLKVGTKSLPSPYVKLYLMKSKKCLAKSKTMPARRTLDPLYQQQFIFREDYTNCVLQLIVWGDYGKKDRKSLMGIVQIRIDDLDISNLVIGWYRMFNAPSMAHSLVSSKALRHMLLSKTIDTE